MAESIRELLDYFREKGVIVDTENRRQDDC